MNRGIALSMIAATLFASAGCRTYGTDQDFELTAPWRGYQRIVVRSPRGSVTLRTADVPEIRISGTKYASGSTPSEAEENLRHVAIIAEPDTSDASVFVVQVRHPWWLGSRSVGGSFEIQVPAPCAADIQTDNGNIAVSGLKDEVILKTNCGEVAIDGITGRVRARTCNGSIVAKNVIGDLIAETSNGRIVAENVTGDLTAETTNGGIRAKAVRGTCKLQTPVGTIEAEDIHGGLEARVSVGDIRAQVIPPEGANVVLRTTCGSVDLTLPADLKADLDLRTNNGVVQTTLEGAPLKVQLWSQNRVKAKMNGGGGSRIIASTSNGLITVESR